MYCMAILWIPNLGWGELFVCAALTGWFFGSRLEALWRAIVRQIGQWL